MAFRRTWLLAALGFMTLGVPVIACGGRAIVQDTGDAGGTPTGTGGTATGHGSNGSPTSSPTGSGTSTGTSTGTPTGSGTVTPTPTGTGSGGSFGPYPCTAYTAIYNECPPVATAAGCQYYSEWGNPPQGINPSPGESALPGCRIEIVPPTSTGGTTCEHVDCVCTDNGTWQKDPATPGFPCPQ
jgi:hypothetical protein